MRSSCRSRAFGGDVLVPSIEDLIILKLMSGEDKDVEDVKRLLRLPNLDLPYLLRVRAMPALIRIY
ncbi:DUF6036 family nucleotidyltransferase [Vulcanisaeta distributa]|uniref:DUF6036 family nucleotidyltransferase n=1 Tax=Vulcanisaeta distributa TaxID=164451 RepID=UPI000B1CC726|nr:DUF6036 family nucleotidyltransferase [Vulcanisaeta distributa]